MDGRRDGDRIMKWWPLIAAISMGLIFYGVASGKMETVDNNSAAIINHESRISKVEQAVSELPEIRRDIKEILRRLR